ncbi:hypothetical protein KKB44_03005 [Candidatus Micrarchaeota archaeon]|nr:hypothetical protein [Candidatus Micrarchaeota archaeon]
MKERRRLLQLRKKIDEAPIPQRETMKWMARMLGPEKLNAPHAPFPAGKKDVHMSRSRGKRFEQIYWEGLPPKYMIIFEMRKKGKTYAEIGEVFGQSTNNMRRIWERTMRILKNSLRICEPVDKEMFEKFEWLFELMGIRKYEDLKLTK